MSIAEKLKSFAASFDPSAHSAENLEALRIVLERMSAVPYAAVSAPAVSASSVAVWTYSEMDVDQQRLLLDAFAEAKIIGEVKFYYGNERVIGEYVVHMGSYGGRCLEPEAISEAIAKYPNGKVLFAVKCINPAEVPAPRVSAALMTHVVLGQSCQKGVRLILEKSGADAIAAKLASMMIDA